MTFILDPHELARTLRRDLGEEYGTKYAEMIGRGGTELGIAYREAARIMRKDAACSQCGVYPAGTHRGICEGCEAYAEHASV